MKRVIYNIIIKILPILLLMLKMSDISTAATFTSLHISDINVTVDNKTTVKMTINPAAYHQPRNSRLVVTPVIRSLTSNDSILLPAYQVAGTNSWYRQLRENKPAEGILLRAGHGKPYHYAASVDFEEWMNRSEIDFIVTDKGCCNALKSGPDSHPVAEIDLRKQHYATTSFPYNTNVQATPKTRVIEGKAYINFPVNRTEIYPDYMVNPVELHKITGTIDSVKNNSDITVKSIRLVGFASPEGPYLNNVRLADGRTLALKEYVRKQYTFPASTFHTASVPEDWEGLREAIAAGAGNLADREQLLAFIDDESTPIEVKNDRFRARFPESYEWLLENVYPSLRHTNYEITYDIRVYTDIDEIKEVMRTRPQDLSLAEIYQVAGTYPQNSLERLHAYQLAAELNRDNAQANLNAASASIELGDYQRAENFLQRCPATPESLYLRGTVAALQENYAEARDYFKLSGNEDAHKALDKIEQITAARRGVTYICE